MKDQDFDTGFPWTLAFLTTGVCSLGFIGIMKILENSFPRFFLWIGIVSLSLACISGIASIFLKEKK